MDDFVGAALGACFADADARGVVRDAGEGSPPGGERRERTVISGHRAFLGRFYLWKLVTAHKEYTFAAPSAEQRASWVGFFRSALVGIQAAAAEDEQNQASRGTNASGSKERQRPGDAVSGGGGSEVGGHGGGRAGAVGGGNVGASGGEGGSSGSGAGPAASAALPQKGGALQEARNTLFCPSQEKFHTVVYGCQKYF